MGKMASRALIWSNMPDMETWNALQTLNLKRLRELTYGFHTFSP
jgi:hypothetical protein